MKFPDYVFLRTSNYVFSGIVYECFKIYFWGIESAILKEVAGVYTFGNILIESVKIELKAQYLSF